MSDYRKPLPEPDADSRPYWDGCARHKLMLQRCGGCGRYSFPPSPACPDCHEHTTEWREATGRGSVYSWIVVTHPVPKPVFGDDVPYVVTLIELEEGVRMPSNVVGCEPGAVEDGMAVEVVFDDVAEGVALPKFRPRAD